MSKSLKILYHHRTQNGDAQGIHISEMINAFKIKKHMVEEFSLIDSNGNQSNKKKSKFFEIIAKSVPKFLYEIMEILYNVYGYIKLKEKVKSLKPHFIYERYAGYNFCGVLVAKHTNTKIILEVNAPLYHEKIIHDKLVFKRLFRWIENWVCNNATQCIVVTSTLKDILVKQGVKGHKLNIMLNGINYDHFRKPMKINVREKYNISPDTLVIGMVAWYRKWHGLDTLIKTCHRNDLFKSKNVCLLIVGDGPALPECKKYVEENSLQDKVIFTGSVEHKNVPDYLRIFNIALQPKVTNYACPMKIIEYLAMSKVVIAPDQQNIRDILTDQKNSLLFKPNDTGDLYNKIECLINNPKLMSKLSANAIAVIGYKNLTWIENVRRTIDLLDL